MKFPQFTKILFLLLLSSSLDAEALVCPQKDNAPLCPQNGSTLLDDTYPTQSFLISNQPYVQTKEAQTMTKSFVKKIIENYDYENVPQIILSLENPDEFKSIKDGISKNLSDKKIDPIKAQKILDQITHLKTRNLNWQQDWFESFIDPKTGAPTIRQIESYSRATANNSALLSDAGKCDMQDGEWIKTDMISDGTDPRTTNQSFNSGEMGGNIEGAPGGFCMVGDNQGKDFTTQFCKKENIIQLQTSWLSVGHVDELFKIIPTQFNDGRPRECEFSLMAASPKKALELMKNPESGKAPFAEINNPDSDPVEEREARSHTALAGNSNICRYMKEVISKRPAGQDLKPAVKSVFLKLVFGTDAMASFDFKSILSPEITENKEIEALNQECAKNIDKVSNFEIQEMMLQDPSFIALNTTVDNSLAKDREQIKNKILSRLPQCKAYYSEIEVPNLFYGDSPIKNKDGSLSLSRPGTADSFLPNPTNSVIMNKTVTFSNTGNPLFNRYLSDEMAKKKMKSDFISTWDYAHLAKGNLHCASHSLPYCRPNTKGSK